MYEFKQRESDPMALITAAQNGDFFTGSTWIGGASPGATDTFQIPAGITVTTSGGNNTSRNTGGYGITGTLAFSGGAYSTIKTMVVNAGGVLLASGSGTLIGSTVTVNAGGTLSLILGAQISGNTQTIYGTLSLADTSSITGGTQNINSGGALVLSGSASLTGGNQNISAGATLSLANSSSIVSPDAGHGDGSVFVPSTILSSGAIFKNTTGAAQPVQLTDSTASGGAVSLNNAIIYSKVKFNGNNAIFG
jgi:hypothetical protein